MSGDFDDLFVAPRNGSLSWLDKLGPEAREWVDELARSCVERGQFPNWPVTTAAYHKLFPKEPRTTDTTISKHIKNLVTELSNDNG